MKHPKINLIVAACEGMGIGMNNKLPWRLRSELEHFSKMTKRTVDPSKQNVVIMGRRTWESIPEKFRPLANRINIILSSTLKPSDVHQDVIVKDSFNSVLELLQDNRFLDVYETAWVIGGSSVYKSAISSDFCHRIYLTKIFSEFECDTFLDPIDGSVFKLVSDPLVPQDVQVENGVSYKFLVYEKVQE